jgi:hypothetical protein
MESPTMSQSENPIDKFKPDHLTDDEGEQTSQAAKVDVQAKEEKANPRNKNTFTFTVKHRAIPDDSKEAVFTSKILSIADRQNMGVMRSRMQGGAPIESLDALTLEINLIVAHLTYSLTARPEWAEDLLAVSDVSLLQAVYEEVAGHEAYFHGRSTDKEES